VGAGRNQIPPRRSIIRRVTASNERTLDTDRSNVWGFPRYFTLLVVLLFHLALLALLLTASPTGDIPLPANRPVELVYLSPASFPKIRAENSLPHRLRSEIAMANAPPVLDSSSVPPSPPASGSDGSGSGVDWKAEARRAVQAFEIRKHQPPSNDTVSRSSPEDTWWPEAKHHAGEQYKTASGDWIVWINASCYQVATSAANPSASGATPPQTICPCQPNTPRNDRSAPMPGCTTQRPRE
jgi:hypothetical protein